MPTAYGYVRVSSNKQARAEGTATAGLSIEAQEQQVRAYFALKLEPLGVVFGEVLRELAVSAELVPIRQRPEGSRLAGVLKKGDHLIIAKMDRGFRNTADLVQTLDLWDKIGVFLHLVDISMDTSSPTGRMICEIMAILARWENRLRGQRVLDANAVRRQLGLPVGAVPPYGHKILRYRVANSGKIQRKLLANPEERAWGQKFLAWRQAGWSVFEMYVHLRDHGAINPRTGNAFSPRQCESWPGMELALQRLEAEKQAAASG